MSERRNLLGDLSWLQIVVGALAAMTSAWIASTLGVRGTIIGAAIGSMVIPISSALYDRGLDKGRVLVVRTNRGTTVEQHIDGDGSDTEILDEVAKDNPDVRDASILSTSRRLRWRPIVLTSVVVLVLAIAAIGAVEVLTDQPYGGDPGNARIGNPFSGGIGSETDPAGDPVPAGDTPAPDAPAPDEPDPTPTPSPTETSPSAAPTPDVPSPDVDPVDPAE